MQAEATGVRLKCTRLLCSYHYGKRGAAFRLQKRGNLSEPNDLPKP
jgi:hypothetical protein